MGHTPQSSGSAKTFVAAEGERVAGFFSLTVGQVDTLEAPERIRKGMGQYPLPVVILARLGVAVQDQGARHWHRAAEGCHPAGVDDFRPGWDSRTAHAPDG